MYGFRQGMVHLAYALNQCGWHTRRRKDLSCGTHLCSELPILFGYAKTRGTLFPAGFLLNQPTKGYPHMSKEPGDIWKIDQKVPFHAGIPGKCKSARNVPCFTSR